MKTLWIDLINPSHSLFFASLLRDFQDFHQTITFRDRAETVELARLLGLEGTVVGRDYRDSTKKTINMVYRTLSLFFQTGSFDFAMSFENGMSVFVAKMRKKPSVLFCDNDLKFQQMTSKFQDIESKIKMAADYIFVPQACYENFIQHVDEERVIFYEGYKEDVYIANYTPDPHFFEKIPFQNYVVIRPEALGSFYVNEKTSIVPDLLDLFKKENINVIYLPREREDYTYAIGFDEVYIPKNALNGLDLCYYADAVLTGSGTMAREAACMGKKAVSFFPSSVMLSVDTNLINERRIYHSRNPIDILDYLYSQRENNLGQWDSQSQKVKKTLIRKIQGIMNSN